MTEPLIIEALQTADSCVIWLHGLGANKYDFEPVAKALQPLLPHTRFVLPEAPIRPVTLNGGFACTSWYDITSITPHRSFSLKELEQSADLVIALIKQNMAQNIASKRIVLAGFSQGGAVVLHAGILRFTQELGGILALSTYAPSFSEQISVSEIKHGLPVAVMHGLRDQVVPLELGQSAYQKLRNAKIAATWHTYHMAHELCQPELDDIAAFLIKLLA